MTVPTADLVRTILNRAIGAGLAPGLVAGWQTIDDDRPTTVAAGRAAVHPVSAPVTPDTWFDLASLTKPLVIGTLSLLMTRTGELSLDTMVGDVLTETDGSLLGARTVGQLLTHCSGLPAWEPLYALSEGRPERAVEALSRMKVGEAETHVIYSCPGFIVLGMMLSRLADTGLDDLFEERVLTPLDLTGQLAFRPDPSHPLAAGAETPDAERMLLAERGIDSSTIPDKNPAQTDDGNARFLGSVSGNAGLFGSVRGVLVLARAHLLPGALLTACEISKATADHTPGLEQARGLGWQLASSPGCSAGPALGSSAFGHTGFTGTSVWVDPERGVAMALLANRVHPGHRNTDLHPLRRRFHQLVIDRLT